jgi:hypothetical protein
MTKEIQAQKRRIATSPLERLAHDEAANAAVAFTIAGVTITFAGLLAWLVGGVVLMWFASLGLGGIFGLAGFIMVGVVIFLLVTRGG